MADQTLVERVMEKRIPKILDEFQRVFPEATLKSYVDNEGRGVMKVMDGEYLIGLEFVETDVSWKSNRRMWEYYVALVNKCRLVVFAPAAYAMDLRRSMLELNHHWLCYYMVYSYDQDLNFERLLRPKVVPGTTVRVGVQPLGGYL